MLHDDVELLDQRQVLVPMRVEIEEAVVVR
jgi:hypothetical protein